MHKDVIAVVFAADAPIDGFRHLTNERAIDRDDVVRYMDCEAVEETTFGFLRLIPKRDLTGGVAVGIFIPPAYVLYMVQGAEARKIGF